AVRPARAHRPGLRPPVVEAPARARRWRHRHGFAADVGLQDLARRRVRGDLRLDGDRRHRRRRGRLLRRPHGQRPDADHRLLPRHPRRAPDDRRRRDLGAEPVPHRDRDRDPALDEHRPRAARPGEERARARLRQAGAGTRLYHRVRGALGGSHTRIVLRHVLPQIAPLLIANTVLTIAVAIFDETALAFLGLSDTSRISLGKVIENGFQRAAISAGAWWAIVPPGIVVAALILCCSLIGQALEDALNPRL